MSATCYSLQSANQASNASIEKTPFAIRLWTVTTGQTNPAAVRRATDPTTSGINTSWSRRLGVRGSTSVPFRSRKTARRMERLSPDRALLNETDRSQAERQLVVVICRGILRAWVDHSFREFDWAIGNGVLNRRRKISTTVRPCGVSHDYSCGGSWPSGRPVSTKAFSRANCPRNTLSTTVARSRKPPARKPPTA